MAKKTYKELLAHCKAASSWMYVYGMKGSVMTLNQYNSLKRMYGSMVWNSDKNKVGKVCCDCSGLISSCTGIIRSSANYKSTATATATIAQLKVNWNAYVGWGIWLNGHIGVVSDTPGYYYAMDGSARNWVHNELSKNNWTLVIKLCDIDYSQAAAIPTLSPVVTAEPHVIYRVYANKKWWAQIVDCNDTSAEGYAGVEKYAISGLTVGLSLNGTGLNGAIKYQAHTNSGWYPFVTGYNINDGNNGYAGVLGKSIDAIKISTTLPGYDVLYRVSTTSSKDYLPWVKNLEDYAGIFGRPIDKVQVKLVRK